MKIDSLKSSLQPRDGKTLRVLGICRISTENQNELSLDDQRAYYERFLRSHYSAAFELETIKSQGSGEWKDRPELIEIDKKIRSRRYDLFISEDLSRLMRDYEALRFIGICRDHDSRYIAINDGVDSADSYCDVPAILALYGHSKNNQATSDRIKRTLRNRFTQGGVIQNLIYGYVKPTGTKSISEVQKDPEAEEIYNQWFTMLEQGQSYSAVADWLNSLNIPLPKTVHKSKRWNVYIVREHTLNPILKGMRQRNRMMTVKHHESGHRKPVKAPPGELLINSCPHLAFIDPERYDRVVALLKARNQNKGRKPINGQDPLRYRPKKRTAFPGQMVTCGICGRQLVYGSHGQENSLSCHGGKDYLCWNSISLDSKIVQTQVPAMLLHFYKQLPIFAEDFFNQVQQELEAADNERRLKRAALESEKVDVEKSATNVLDLMQQHGNTPIVIQAMKRIEERQAELKVMELELARLSAKIPKVPDPQELALLAENALKNLDVASFEFAAAMRKVITRFVVLPYRLCDGGHPVLRAFLTINLLGLADIPSTVGGSSALTRHVVLDLFAKPQRVTHREQVLGLLSQGLDQRSVAQQLGITQPAVQHAVALNKIMIQHGLSDPYVLLMAPPADYRKLRSWRHRRYQFTPLPGYPIQTEEADSSTPPHAA